MKTLTILFFIFSNQLFSQDLFSQRIRKISTRKKAIFFDSGIFHNGSDKRPSVLKAMRHSYSAKNGYERVVFDFEGSKVPRIYGNIASKSKKIFIDFFDTSLNSKINSFGKSKLINGIRLFPLSEESLSVEIDLKNNSSADIFYLEKPGRLVLDLKI